MSRIQFQIDPRTPRVVARMAGGEHELPPLWLRERCQDPEHVDPQTHQRLFNPNELPDNLALTAAEPGGAGEVWLSFSDGYRGRHDLDALADDFDLNDRLPAPKPWDARLY